MLRKIDPTLEKINGAFGEGSEESQKYHLMHWIWWLGAKGERLGVEYSAEALCGPKDRMDWSFLYSILEGFGFDQVVHFGMPVLSTPQWQPSWILPFSHKVYDRAIPSRYFFSSLLITTLAYPTIPDLRAISMEVVLLSHVSLSLTTIIFANNHKKSIRRLLDCLKHYEGISDSLMNREKSELILHWKASLKQIKRLKHLTSFRHQQPFTHLGSPYIRGLSEFSYMMTLFRR